MELYGEYISKCMPRVINVIEVWIRYHFLGIYMAFGQYNALGNDYDSYPTSIHYYSWLIS
jgi:hypothetical protein